MMWLFSQPEFWYLFTTFLFGVWYYRERVNWEDEFTQVLGPIGCSLLTCWWYWPLMIVYLISDSLKAKKKREEEIVSKVRGY